MKRRHCLHLHHLPRSCANAYSCQYGKWLAKCQVPSCFPVPHVLQENSPLGTSVFSPFSPPLSPTTSFISSMRRCQWHVIPSTSYGILCEFAMIANICHLYTTRIFVKKLILEAKAPRTHIVSSGLCLSPADDLSYFDYFTNQPHIGEPVDRCSFIVLLEF